jgi:hypothetical protein
MSIVICGCGANIITIISMVLIYLILNLALCFSGNLCFFFFLLDYICMHSPENSLFKALLNNTFAPNFSFSVMYVLIHCHTLFLACAPPLPIRCIG